MTDDQFDQLYDRLYDNEDRLMAYFAAIGLAKWLETEMMCNLHLGREYGERLRKALVRLETALGDSAFAMRRPSHIEAGRCLEAVLARLARLSVVTRITVAEDGNTGENI